MKWFILVPDGCGDWPITELGGKTPMEAAEMPFINALAKESEVGTVKTIPDGMEPGSEVANLSILGFDPAVYLKGRASLEAVGVGIDMSEEETAFRVNLITLDGTGPYNGLTIKDHGAGDISDGEAKTLIDFIDREMGNETFRFYPGVSYRNLLITSAWTGNYILTPPHNVLGQPVSAHLPKGETSGIIENTMRRSYDLLKNHPVNKKRMEKGLHPANSLWFWGAGKKPALPSFEIKYGVKGSVISAVSLVKGIGLCAGLTVVNVPGATGTLHTNYKGKAEYGINEFEKGKDFVFIHVEAPDECSHTGDLAGKVESLRRIDAMIFEPVVSYLKKRGEPFRVLVLPDHMTPITIRTHSTEPVPFILYDSEIKRESQNDKAFSEASGKMGVYFKNGYDLTDYFFSRG
jgi:2,3-bisphosphoglycerate-independent phosphoglycerate mutase